MNAAQFIDLYNSVDQHIAHCIRTGGSIQSPGTALAVLSEFGRQAEQRYPALVDQLHPRASAEAALGRVRKSTASRVRRVLLTGGPSDGMFTQASHLTAWAQGELYVWDGGEDRDKFIHAPTALEQLEKEDIITYRRESELVHRYLIHRDESTVAEIPPWRLNAWVQMLLTTA